MATQEDEVGVNLEILLIWRFYWYFIYAFSVFTMPNLALLFQSFQNQAEEFGHQTYGMEVSGEFWMWCFPEQLGGYVVGVSYLIPWAQSNYFSLNVIPLLLPGEKTATVVPWLCCPSTDDECVNQAFEATYHWHTPQVDVSRLGPARLKRARASVLLLLLLFSFLFFFFRSILNLLPHNAPC